MASKHARRISSLFSLRKNSTEKTVENSKSPPTLALPTFSDEPSAIIVSEPVPSTLEPPTSSNEPSAIIVSEPLPTTLEPPTSSNEPGAIIVSEPVPSTLEPPTSSNEPSAIIVSEPVPTTLEPPTSSNEPGAIIVSEPVPTTSEPPTSSNEPSAIIVSEPVPTTLEPPTSSNAQPSSLVPSLQTPPDDPSEAPLVPPDNSLLPVPQMVLPLPEDPGPQTANRPRSCSESRLEVMAGTVDKSEEEYRVGNKGGRRPASGVENRSGSWQDSPTTLQQPATSSGQGLSRRRSWLPTRSKPAPLGEVDGPGPWLIRPNEKLPYDATPLIQFQKVPELWQDHGDTIIYLHAGGAKLGPSFKLDSACYASSRKLSMLVGRKSQTGRQRSSSQAGDRAGSDQTPNSSLHPPPSPASPPPPSSSPRSGSLTTDSSSSSRRRRAMSESFDEGAGEVHLHIPLPLQSDLTVPDPILTSDDVETLVAIRNVFAFLVEEPLVATSRHSSVFSIFLRIANFLHLYEFTNLDGSTLGEESASNFGRYLRDFKLADVRTSREKVIEAVVLGERMKFFDLYSEGFVHAVGRYDDLIKLESPKFHYIAEITRLRLERAQIDLSTRLKTVRTRLKDFEFPALFSGIASSTTSMESKLVRFKAWRFSFLAMRRHVMSFYRQRYGAWPPSAKSKKNSFEESGLNRILLLELYQDFCDLYDVLVNRDALTTRSAELNSEAMSISTDTEESAPALRKVLGEFDHSSPPVQPPIPFDTPLLPSLTTTRRGYNSLEPRRQKKERTKPLEADEINKALMQSYNRDSIRATPFLEAFMSFERKQAHGKSIDEMMELRNGQWMLLYAVLQSLPLVVIDAPDVKWTEGVEYFLCEVPKGTAPWCPEDSNRKMSWYGIAGGMGVVSLPAELVEHGVEGIYRRSHCWKVAEKWTGDGDFDTLVGSYQSPENLPTPTLQLPSDLEESESTSTVSVPLKKRASIHIGLEALPLPAGVAPSGAKHTSYYDPQKSFADILEQLKNQTETKKKE